MNLDITLVSKCCQAVLSDSYKFDSAYWCPCCDRPTTAVKPADVLLSEWKEIQQIKLEKKARKRASETDILLTLKEDGFEIQSFTLYHFRVNGVLDIFPTSKKFHDIKADKRGRYKDVLDFVYNHFLTTSQ